MTEPDDLIEEARKAGQAYIESFKGDNPAMLADLRRRAEAQGRRIVTLAPKRPTNQQSPNRRTATA